MRMNPEQKKILKNLSLICIISTAIFFALEFILKNYVYHHQSSVFISFMMMPVMVLVLMKKPLRLGKINKGFVYGIAVYLLLLLWILPYYFFNPDFFDVFKVSGLDFITFNILIIMNIMPVDFFSKRVIQLEIAERFGEMIGMYAQIIAWMVGHVYELFWLKELMGCAGSLLFIAFSGIITGFVYSKTKNVFGFMIGHWMLNLLMIILIMFI
ncbi:MAG: hypothetical protein QMC80_01165 [Thermoplasmatales archaeon]|nr:hypothetical protein [Thermoplasmatales archaeon]